MDDDFDAEDLCRFGVEHLYSFGGISELATFGTIADYWRSTTSPTAFATFGAKNAGVV